MITPLNIALLTLSDTRSLADDTSGDYLAHATQQAGHQVVDRKIIRDEKYSLRAIVSTWIADEAIQVILTTGGTGFASRDSTPEALLPLLDQRIPGFGELFRSLSYEDIGSSTVQSRAVAGLANGTFIAALPGSTGACRLAWERILREQLDSQHAPCNFVSHLKAAARTPSPVLTPEASLHD